MAMESDVQSEEDKDNADLNVIETGEDESEEDEDVDFNPFFMKGSPSEEASSSLSSEVEGLDVDVVSSRSEDVVRSPVGVSDHVGGMVDERVGVSNEGEKESGTVHGVDKVSTSGANVVADDSEALLDLGDTRGKSKVDFDDEDAICKRTRARYSLASFTLDELETFLQETDDEDDFQNVDEEEEYRKFLTAVLKGGDGDDQGNVEGNDDDDEDDEDNDADFEIEIEEALESDVDDCVITSLNAEDIERTSLRPQTRQNRRQKTTSPSKKKGLKVEERPLRPLVPVMFRAPNASVPCLGTTFATNSSSTQCLPLNGFVDHQIGQLYCLVYEHVQLLIQVYSLCALDPSRQHIANQVKGLLAELLHKRDLVLTWRNVEYPDSCFAPPHVNSVSAQTQHYVPYSTVASDGTDDQGCRWLPSIGGPVLSVLDVEPLKLAGKYIDDVSNAVREHQKRCVETTNYLLEKQPLFPHPACSSPEIDCNATIGDDPSPNRSAVISNDKVPKKTLAATLVENTKKQSVALVPEQIAKLAQPFYPLFNSELFPHKPPPSSVANRVLFTDSEDVLLSMGMMEYNNHWKAIQQRFLPCKTEHQIFVRVKNRCSSKAPDNPIKTVRKLKTSPLTADEKALIEEALKTFRLDWTSVWRAVVPYRDPNLLPRQWRIAIGTQKSYKTPSSRKEKHRVYEANRRRRKTSAMDNSHTVSEEDNQMELCGPQCENGEDGTDKEAYVHEAFLADWRPFTAGLNAPKVFASNLNSRCLPGNLVPTRFCGSQEVPNHGNKETPSIRDHAQDFSVGSENSHPVIHKSFQAYAGSGYPPTRATSRAFGCESFLHSQNAQKPGITNVVKLAPELPPVKLPPAVRVISQASLRSSQLVSSTEVVHDKTRVLNPNSASVSSQKCESLNNKNRIEDKGAELDPQMHPLLYRSLEESHVPSFSVNNPSRIPTFSFFPAFQNQLNGHARQDPPLPVSATGLKSSSSKEMASTSSSLDFHPFLQRTSDVDPKSFGSDSTRSPLTTDLELSRDSFEEIGYRAGTDAAQLAAPSKPNTSNIDATDLDLGIHLSTSRKRKASSHEGAEMNPMVPSVSVGNSVEVAKGIASPDNSAARTDKLGHESNSCINDNVGYQPPLEIVMEQEELSDSDEELDDVEFECEEMTDSDGEEGSAAEPIVNTRLEEQENTTPATEINEQCSKPGTCDVSKASRAPRKRRTPTSCWLSLNSGDSNHAEQASAKITETSNGVLPRKSHSKRYSRRLIINPKISSAVQKGESSRLDPSRSSSRKHRKHRKQLVKAPDVKDSCTAKDAKV
ncbi:uncharacterized protein LOC141646958 isoform X2 [Silene latifolia]|uniref:uncharacterized protein LOC141646958 isoform X2 n=1 Tax=Silene latifolia TaxID=37657 RepID=UPI003D789B6A